ncbi:MAG: hypothetical protein AB8G86_17165 [Saprospiraceae bacterium]
MHASTFSTIFFVLLLILVLFIACSKKTTPAIVPPVEATISQPDKIEQLGKTLFKQDFSLDYNKDKTVVCISKAIKTRPNDIFSTLSFVLYQVESEETLFQEAMPKSTGKWLNNKEFQVTTVPGRMSGRAASIAKNGYIYNVVTKTKRQIK